MARASPGIELEIRWGASVLHVAHLTPPRSVYVGESSASCDCAIPAALLGAGRAPLVIVAPDGSIWLAVLPGATGIIDVMGQPQASIRAAIAEGRARRCEDVRGAYLVPLPSGARAHVEIGGLAIHVAHAPIGLRIARRVRDDRGGVLPVGLSLVAHASLLVASAFAMPALLDTTVNEEWDAPPYLIVARVEAVPEVDRERRAAEPAETINPDDRELVNSRCAREDGGSMGEPSAGLTQHRYGVQGPSNNPDPHVARSAATPDAIMQSLIGPFQGHWGGDPRAPMVAWGRDDSLGNDERSARGGMWGDDLGTSFGSPGAGVGRNELCDTCGGIGRGTRDLPTTAGGPTRTESTCDLEFAVVR